MNLQKMFAYAMSGVMALSLMTFAPADAEAQPNPTSISSNNGADDVARTRKRRTKRRATKKRTKRRANKPRTKRRTRKTRISPEEAKKRPTRTRRKRRSRSGGNYTVSPVRVNVR